MLVLATTLMKAKIVEVNGKLSLKIIEKYVATRDIVLELIRATQAAVVDMASTFGAHVAAEHHTFDKYSISNQDSYSKHIMGIV